MDIVSLERLHKVVRADDTGIRDGLGRIVLGLTQAGAAVAVGWIVQIGSDLHHVERHGTVLVAPVGAPLPYHIRHTVDELVLMVDIGTSLIPDEPASSIALERDLHGVIHLERTQVEDHLVNRFLAKVFGAVGGKGLTRKPTLDAGSSPRERYYPDGNVQHLVELAGEEIPDCAHLRNGIGICSLPAVSKPDLVERFVRLVRTGIEHPDAVPCGSLRQQFVVSLYRAVVEPLDGDFHVGLARGQPDFPDQDVIDRQ